MQPSFASLVVLVSVLGAGLAACDGGSSAGAPEALMTAGDLRSHPWPSDALLGADGHVAVTPPFSFAGDDAYQALLAASLSELDGFGTTTSVFFPVSAKVEVDDQAAAQVIDLDGDDPPLTFPLFYREATQQLVAMAPPGTVLRERHRYGCIVDAGVHGGAGPLRASAAMTAALRAETAPPGSYALLAERLASAAPPVA